MTKAELARSLGISRSTLYQWLTCADCPDPDTAPDEFLQWCEGRKAESRGGGLQRDVANSGDLKSSKLKAECLLKWQSVSDYEATMQATIEAELWDEMQTWLSEYRSELERLPITDDQRDALNQALQTACDRTEERRGDSDQRLEQKLAELRELVLASSED